MQSFSDCCSHIHIGYLKKFENNSQTIRYNSELYFVIYCTSFPNTFALFLHSAEFDNLMEFKGVRGSFDSQTPSDLNVKTSFYFSTLIITTAGTKNNLWFWKRLHLKSVLSSKKLLKYCNIDIHVHNIWQH